MVELFTPVMLPENPTITALGGAVRRPVVVGGCSGGSAVSAVSGVFLDPSEPALRLRESGPRLGERRLPGKRAWSGKVRAYGDSEAPPPPPPPKKG